MNTQQLTRHPVGSLREVWAMSWPLMISLLSTSFMMFVDRLMLSKHSSAELNALVTGGLAYYIFLLLPMCICEISEVLVGRLHGEGSVQKIGRAVWQMVLFAFILTPLFGIIAVFAPDIVFYKSDNISNETIYFKTLMNFGPFVCASLAFSGFFIGTGKMRFIVYAMLLANIFNLILGYLLIFGYKNIPSLGIYGAALATGISQIFQMALFILFFLKKQNRATYGSSHIGFPLQYMKEGIRIGLPAGLGKVVEVLAHFFFFRIVMMAGAMHMTLVVLVGSFYIGASFISEAQSKGVSSIIANLLGAEKRNCVHKVLRSAFKLEVIFFILFSLFLFFFSQAFLRFFLPTDCLHYLQDQAFLDLFHQCILYLSLFFLFDGLGWILVGCLTAAGDTKFVFYVSTLLNWLGYTLPTYILINLFQKGANTAWAVIAVYSVIGFLLYYWRFRSGRWLKNYRPVS
jgi:MATE family multidrug resistance protein